MYVQCKRPFREATLTKNIREAGKQLVRDLDDTDDPDARGIIAISVSRVFTVGDKLFAGANEVAVRERLGDTVEALADACRHEWGKIADSRLIGILFHVITPAHIQDIDLLTAAQYVVAVSLPDRSVPDVELVRAFASAVQADGT